MQAPKRTQAAKTVKTATAETESIGSDYPVSVTPHVLSLMEPGNAADPLARQYLPDAREAIVQPDESGDPIGDDRHSPVRGIVHRYPDRVLLKPVHVCAVYCRFCFRREMVGPGQEVLNDADMQAALDYIRATPAIWEVIVTGGDPFILSPRRIRAIVDALEHIDHVRVIRFHTRVPVADPARVTRELVEALHSEKAVYVSVHCNHANELSPEARAALARLNRAGIALLAQTVLLKGVNDDPATLEHLFRELTALCVRPYYLHHCDKAPGTSHFRTGLKTGRAIMKTLLSRLSGIARPSYVLDIPGGYGKVPVNADFVQHLDAGTAAVSDATGCAHLYSDAADADAEDAAA